MRIKLVHNYNQNKVDISSITIDRIQNIISNVDLRYRLSIPFKNRMEGIIVTVILMNPAQANLSISDKTVNKLIDYFYSYSDVEMQVKQLVVGNVIPIYSSHPSEVAIKLKELNAANKLAQVELKNIQEINSIISNSDKVVFAWGKPDVKTIHNLYYYSQVNRVIELVRNDEENVYIFDISNANMTFTEHGDPRHAGGSAQLNGLIKTNINELLGLI